MENCLLVFYHYFMYTFILLLTFCNPCLFYVNIDETHEVEIGIRSVCNNSGSSSNNLCNNSVLNQF